MKTCPSCGLPAPGKQTRCGFCDSPLPAPLPASFRAEAAGSIVLVHSDGVPICVARRNANTWTVAAPDGTTQFRLSPVTTASGTTLGVTDHDGALLGTVRLARTGDRSAEVRDASGETIAAAYVDGPTELHLVGAFGRVLGLVSTREGAEDDDEPGADMLLTESGQRLPVALVVAMAIGLAAPAKVRAPRT